MRDQIDRLKPFAQGTLCGVKESARSDRRLMPTTFALVAPALVIVDNAEVL
jgi:hypothetical protein